MIEAFLGLDIGTSTIKAGIFAADGLELALVVEEYLQLPEGEPRLEFDAEALWRAACRVIGAAVNAAPDARVAAVAVSTHAETLVLLDGEGKATRPAIFTTDCRAEGEGRELASRFGLEWILQRTGQPEMTGAWPCSKLLWLARHEPEVLRRTAHILLPGDYVLYRLCGESAAEQASWGSAVMVDLATRDWLAPMLDAIGVRREQLPTLVAPGTVVGAVTAAAAGEAGLPPGTAVVVGSLDQNCAAVGAGNVQPGIVSVSTGSVLALVATIGHPVFDAATKVGCYTYPVAGTYCLLPWNPTGGLVLKWFKDRFGQPEQEEASRTGASVYDILTRGAAAVPPGCDGLTMVPHLQGSLFPQAHPSARGAFYGVTLAHGRAHFTRAILEAVAFMLRDGLAALRGLGVPVREVRLIGGGARSAVWAQIMADTCQVPMGTVVTNEAAALGAAMLAAAGAGAYDSVAAAATGMARLATTVAPDAAMATAYDVAYDRYRRLYECLKPLFAPDAQT